MLNKKEFEHIFNTYYHSLCKYLLLFTTDFAQIEDVVQSIFIKLWEDRDTITTINVKSYLFIAARNRILNAIRDSRNREDILEDFYKNELIIENAEEIINFEEFYNLVQESVNHLPERTQEVYRLSREQKIPYKIIASDLNISIKTVENHMTNALKRIGDYLKSHYKIPIHLIFLMVTSFFH